MKIVVYPDKILEQKTEQVRFPLSKEDKDLSDEMFKYIKNLDHLAAGLAAPQVGVSKKMCVISDGENIFMKLFNPKIDFFSGDTLEMTEGCLSFPNQFYIINRSGKVRIKYQNEKGEWKKVNASGFFARVIQHEVDHLNGIIFTNKKGAIKTSLEELKNEKK